MSQERKGKDIGALWVKDSKDGKTKYMSGKVTCTECNHDFPVSVLKNTFKEKENQPDYKILPKTVQPQQKTQGGYEKPNWTKQEEPSDLPF